MYFKFVRKRDCVKIVKKVLNMLKRVKRGRETWRAEIISRVKIWCTFPLILSSDTGDHITSATAVERRDRITGNVAEMPLWLIAN